MRSAVLSALVFPALLVACNSKAPVPTVEDTAAPKSEASEMGVSATAVKPLGATKFGEPITEKTSTSLAEVAKDVSKFDGKTIRTEGRVVAVCKAMGCWMEIVDDSTQAHIKMAGHKFLVPKDSTGHKARVQGTVRASEGGGEAECGAKDNCRENAEKETGAVAKVEIEATGVEFID